ncbi:MAG: hypothetical protein DI568_16650 [Sphingomonas sp.]|nr:MAG: hypothetical protein DI568_16650 [Sphingomonas sp.]
MLTGNSRDVARRRDGQIIWGFELVGDVLVLRDRFEEVGKTFAEQDAFFDRLFMERRVLLAGLDQTGMGEKVVEDAKALHGDYRVQGFQLTGPTRLDLGLSLAQRFERMRIRLPFDRRIRADMMAIKKKAVGDSIRLVNDDTVHADMFWAGGIASRLADFPPMEFGYRAVGTGHGMAASGRRDFNKPDHSSDRRNSGGRGWLRRH